MNIDRELDKIADDIVTELPSSYSNLFLEERDLVNTYINVHNTILDDVSTSCLITKVKDKKYAYLEKVVNYFDNKCFRGSKGCIQ